MPSVKRELAQEVDSDSPQYKKPKAEGGQPDRKILIAVDFGTTFSGLAWAQTRKPELQTPVIQWPDATSGGLEGITSDKVPTEIQYEGQNYKWGFQIGDSEQRHQCFKLDLDPSQRRTSSGLAAKFPDPVAEPRGQQFSVDRLTKDYLTALRKHAEQVLRYKLPQSALASTPIEYIITVPAVWSALAQMRTRQCAEQAGMGEGAALHIISEPEAAAMYALDAMDPHNLKIGDTFVLCDAGGGTVDLISYTVSQLRPTLKISEATAGSGTLCGASFLNRIFREFLERKLGKESGWDEEVIEEAMKRFESVIKRQFRGTVGEQFLIPVPGLSDNAELGIRRGRFTLPGAQVKDIFEPVINEVVDLVMGQIKSSGKTIKAVLMVGGFGQNAYLRDRLRSATANLGIEVMQSPNGWTAVVRGALMKGLASTSPSFSTVAISGRCARKHYGVKIGVIFDENKHDTVHQYFDNFKGRHMASVIAWFMTKGSTVHEDEAHRLHYNMSRGVHHGHPGSIRSEVYACSDPTNSGTPTYHDDAGVNLLVTVKADLSRIPVDRLKKKKGADGKMYYMIQYQVKVTYYSAYTKYELVYDGVNYGPIAAEYV